MAAFDPTGPFALFDDARIGGTATLFAGLSEAVTATTAAMVRPALDRLRAPHDFAGFIGFEAGYALEPRLAAAARRPDDGLPLLWFGRFAERRRFDLAELDVLAGSRHGRIDGLLPHIAEPDYVAAVEHVATLIVAGDIYQANLTFAADVQTHGHPLALYRRLRAAQAAPYGALIHTGSAWIMSFSPELFFELAGGILTTRPMKGTAARGTTRAADDAAAAALAADPKNQSENLMIVDLLRNDLSRVAVSGSVDVPHLFIVERYPTLLQMTSTITATARADVGPVEVIEAIFPCGSITGAPKIRAMEVIADIEAEPRGLYTGSIGWIGANGDACFNVAIRTLVQTRPGVARIGLGAGIVADSGPHAEWLECLAKAAFLNRAAGPADLIETIRIEGGVALHLDRHLARLAETAAFLGITVDLASVRAAVDDAARGDCRLRLLVAASGAVAVALAPLPATPPLAKVAVVPLPVDVGDWRLRHKTTDRSFYDEARQASGVFEVLFTRPDGQLTEGSFTSLFVLRGDVLLTPPTTAGLLPGILRAALIAEGRAVEAPLTVADLTGGFFIGNALRGLLPAALRG